MAVIKACAISTSVKNTGKECDVAMLATAMLIAIQSGVTFTDTDMLDPVTWLTTLIQQRKAFPLFGQKAPIRTITNNAEADVTVTLDDGLIVFLRYGIFNRTFETTSGGMCYARSLASFLNSGYSILEIDQQGQMLARKNNNGTYSGIITDFMYSPTPMLADFKSGPYKNRFQYSFGPLELINNGIIFSGASALLSMMGLIDVKLATGGAATATKLKIKVTTACAEADLIASLGAPLATLGNFIVTNKTTGAVITITASAIAAGVIELTGVFVSGQTYNVKGAAPTLWQTNLVVGYDGSATAGDGVDILVP